MYTIISQRKNIEEPSKSDKNDSRFLLELQFLWYNFWFSDGILEVLQLDE